MIGWRNFTEGKICKRLCLLQETHLLGCDTMSTIDSWMRGFLEQLLSLTHSQWIFRNITKHHSTNGTIQLDRRESILKEIERQLNLGVGSLPPESRCLLEIDTSELSSRKTEDQQYWLYAIIAARQAGVRALELSKGKTASWEAIMKDKRFRYLPSQMTKLESGKAETGLSIGSTTENTR